MNIDNDFWMLETELQLKHRIFLRGTHEIQKAKLLVTGAAHLNKQFQQIANNKGLIGHDLIPIYTIFATKQINYFFATYELVKGAQYNAATSILRTLFENYLLLKKLAKDRTFAAQLYQKILIEIKEKEKLKDNPVEYYFYRPNYVSEIWTTISTEKDALDPIYQKFYNFLSNVSTHPHQVDQIWMDITGNREAEKETLSLAISLMYGTLLLTKKALENQLPKETEDEIIQLLTALEKEMPEGIPTFIPL